MNHRNDRQLSSTARRMKPATDWLLLLALTLVGAFAPAAPVMANQEQFASYWKLTFDFANNFNGNLHIDIGYNDGNGGVKAPALVSQDFPVACQRVGSVNVNSGLAIFTGGYLQCQLDVKAAMTASVLECQAKDASCAIAIDDHQIYPHLRMAGLVFSTWPGTTPLFYHQDARYAAVTTSTQSAMTATLTNMGSIASTPVTLPAVMNTWLPYRANYDCNACALTVNVSGVNQVIPVGLDQQVSFYTRSSTIYIGYDPDSGVTIPTNTAIDLLSIDPPNIGSGG